MKNALRDARVECEKINFYSLLPARLGVSGGAFQSHALLFPNVRIMLMRGDTHFENVSSTSTALNFDQCLLIYEV